MVHRRCIVTCHRAQVSVKNWTYSLSQPTTYSISGSDGVCDSDTCSDDINSFFDYGHDESDEENCDSVMDKTANRIVDLPFIVTAIQSRMSCSLCVMKDMNSFILFCKDKRQEL